MFVHSLRLDYDEGLFLVLGNLYKNNGILTGILDNFPQISGVTFNQPPLVSLLYSLLYSFFPLDYGIGRFVNVLLSSFCIILIYIIIKEIWNSETGLVAAIIIMIDPTLVMGILMTMDGLTTFIFCVSCLATVKAIKTDIITWHLIAGASFGLCMLTKWTLAIVPITYVVFYAYYSFWVNKNKRSVIIRNIVASASIAFAIFLPWFIWMGLKGYLPIIFGHTHHIRIMNPFNSLYQTWKYSPILLLLSIFAFMYYFINHKETRILLLYSFFVIFPFFLILPRYYDYSPVLYLLTILAAKPSTILFENSFSLVSRLKKSIFDLDRIKVDYDILLSTVIIMLLIGANGGFIVKTAIFDQDKTIQQTAAFIEDNITESAVIICPSHFGALLIPRHWISSYQETLGDQYFLIFTPNKLYYSATYIEGVEKGFVTENSRTYSFEKFATINDVTIYQLILN